MNVHVTDPFTRSRTCTLPVLNFTKVSRVALYKVSMEPTLANSCLRHVGRGSVDADLEFERGVVLYEAVSIDPQESKNLARLC